jgi:hypothetical protein
MPGLTNSTVLIAAANQIVVALNELTQAVSGLDATISGSNSSGDVVKALRILTAAIASENANVTGPLPDAVDYSSIGLANRLAPTDAENPPNVTDKLQAIYDHLEENKIYHNEIEEMLHAISSVLGYTPRALDQYEE